MEHGILLISDDHAFQEKQCCCCCNDSFNDTVVSLKRRLNVAGGQRAPRLARSEVAGSVFSVAAPTFGKWRSCAHVSHFSLGWHAGTRVLRCPCPSGALTSALEHQCVPLCVLRTDGLVGSSTCAGQAPC